MSGDPLVQCFPFFSIRKGKSCVSPGNCWNFIPPVATLLNKFNQSLPPWMTWIVFYQGEPFSQPEAKAGF